MTWWAQILSPLRWARIRQESEMLVRGGDPQSRSVP
jgi:hypothetical protein